MCLRGHCIPTEPWFEDGTRREVYFSLDGGQEGDYQTGRVFHRCHMCCLGTSPLPDPEHLGVGFAHSQRASPQLQMAGVTGGTVVPCVFAELLVTPHAGVMLVHHTAVLTGVGRVPTLAVGSRPSIYDGLMPESTAHGIKGVCPHARGTP